MFEKVIYMFFLLTMLFALVKFGVYCTVSFYLTVVKFKMRRTNIKMKNNYCTDIVSSAILEIPESKDKKFLQIKTEEN